MVLAYERRVCWPHSHSAKDADRRYHAGAAWSASAEFGDPTDPAERDRK
jgi:hypothetical protein